jgi:ATP-binding cassette subfamily G (WHITE) protein 2 (PDR)
VRKFTSHSEQHHIGSPFADDPRHWLDPKSDQFRAWKWARSFYDLRYSSEESIPRVSGVASRGLNVWGKGSPTDFQSTVGNTILKLPSLFGRGGTHGFQVSSDSFLNYQGIPAKEMNTSFRGEATYIAEADAHFPQLSVGDTLYFAALARAPRRIPGGVSR